MTDLWPWLTLFMLGAYHGINPGMGWLFAVALGMQEKSRRGVLAAIPPIALGHALSIGVVVSVFWFARRSLPDNVLRYAAAATLFGFGLCTKMMRTRHPKWVGMRVGFRDLTLWSFLMASAHGAGLMLVPIMLGWSQGNDVTASHSEHLNQIGHTAHGSPPQMAVFASSLNWLAAVGVHSAGHLLVAALIALVVYEKLGLALLRTAWFNLDLVWMIALMLSGVVILIV